MGWEVKYPPIRKTKGFDMAEVNEFENRKKILFDTALRMFKKYDDAVDPKKADDFSKRYSGMYKAIEIMGFEREFLDYCQENGWDVTIP